jgi:hypothetical protein
MINRGYGGPPELTMLNRQSGLYRIKRLSVIVNGFLPVRLLRNNFVKPHSLLGFSLLFRILLRNT